MANGIGAVQAALMLLAGILFGHFFHPSLLLCLGFFIICLAGGIFFYRRGREYVLDQPPKRISRVLLCLALFAVGMGRVSLSVKERPEGMIEQFAGQAPVSFIGTVISPPTVSSSRTTLRVQVLPDQPEEGSPAGGKLLLIFYHKPETEYHYGDLLQISGNVILPPDTGSTFSYRTYLERQGITAVINNPKAELLPGSVGNPVLAWIYRLRETMLERVYRLFSTPENALMAGILLGDESKIPSDIDHDFQKTGTAHIIAISGANFTLLTWVLLSILRRLVPKWWAPIFMLPVIAFYTVLVGGNSAVTRAAVMCGLSICGAVIGRTGNGINNLALTSALMALVKPSYLFDLGFQLSVTATLGILLFSGPICGAVTRLLARLFPRANEEHLENIVSILNDLCIMSVSAQIFTVWVSAQAFGRLSLISLPANFLIAPFQPLIMLGGFISLGLSFLFYPLGAAAAWLVWTAPALTIRIVRRCAEFRWGSVYFDLPPVQAWLIIGLILLIYVYRNALILSIRRRNYRPYAAMLLVFTAVMLWVNVLDRLDSRTVIEFDPAASSMTLDICPPSNRTLIIADGMTNYAAQKLLEKQILPVRRSPEAAWIDIQEAWMEKEFLESGAAEDLSVLYLNGKTEQAGIPESAGPGFVFSADQTELRLAASFLGKKAWIVTGSGRSLLFPNGIPPERIFAAGELAVSAIDLAVIGKRDDSAAWQQFITEAGGHPALLDRSETGRVTLYLSESGISYK